mmetsp:Transcript_21177/g.58920  ORF Transcript_21177/g.58920 Transcript_21177/m.58920 type:complete len:220 (-) Transcript_21177:1017-1676(-)
MDWRNARGAVLISNGRGHHVDDDGYHQALRRIFETGLPRFLPAERILHSVHGSGRSRRGPQIVSIRSFQPHCQRAVVALSLPGPEIWRVADSVLEDEGGIGQYGAHGLHVGTFRTQDHHGAVLHADAGSHVRRDVASRGQQALSCRRRWRGASGRISGLLVASDILSGTAAGDVIKFVSRGLEGGVCAMTCELRVVLICWHRMRNHLRMIPHIVVPNLS